MASTKSRKLNSRVATLEDAQSSLPVPSTATDGEDITTWRTGGYAPDFASVSIDSDGASTLTAPVNLYGYDVDDAQWRLLGALNSGNNITLTAAVGFEQRVRDVGVFDRLAVSAAGVSAGNITAKARPIEVQGTGA